MRARTSAVWTSRLLTATFAVCWLLEPAAAASVRREVTFAVRVEGDPVQNVRLRVALPDDSATGRVMAPDVTARGLQADIRADGDGRHVVLTGRLRAARRVAITYAVETATVPRPFPDVVPVDDPTPELSSYLAAAALFQTRSILVREFLETHVGPAIAAGEANPLRAIYAATRKHLVWKPDGLTLTLDVIRNGGGKRIGIERAFTTFLRRARIPARFVEGIDLDSSTRTKRVFWTEVWANGAWWPVSASRGWVGSIPASYVPMARDGSRVVEMDGPGDVSYSVHTRLLGEDGG
jgi:transglutaminase-like putative cysteine protease